jgi:hypothetical protein
MRILMCGYNYPQFVSSLRELGHQVYAEPQYFWYARAFGNLNGIPKLHPFEYSDFIEQAVKNVGADVLILPKPFDVRIRVDEANGDSSFWKFSKSHLKRIRDSGVTAVWLTLDDPADFAFGRYIYDQIDVVGTCADMALAMYPQYNPNVVAFRFWPGFDCLQYQPIVRETTERACDFLMIGSTYFMPWGSGKPFPDYGLHRRDVVKAALSLGARVQIWGPVDWLDANKGGDPEFHHCYMGSSPPEKLFEICSNAKITYSNFVRKARGYVTDRVITAAGAGSFNLMETQHGLTDEFVHGQHCGWHVPGDYDDVYGQIAYWLGHTEEREQCASNMRALVLEHHTYSKRAHSLVEAIQRARG